MGVSGLSGDAGQERGGGGLLVGGGGVAGPEADRSDAGRDEVQALEEALDLFQGVDVDPDGGVLRGEVRAFGGVAGADGDDQVAAGTTARAKADPGAADGGGQAGVQQPAGGAAAQGPVAARRGRRAGAGPGSGGRSGSGGRGGGGSGGGGTGGGGGGGGSGGGG